MFYSLNTNDFGHKLALIRKERRLTQKEVSKITGIHTDTLRKIEQGKVIPKFETLDLLSNAYKQDLLRLFIDYRSDDFLINIYNELNDILCHDSFEQAIVNCRRLLKELDTFSPSEMLSKNELLQLKELITCIIEHDSGNYSDQLISRIITTIQLTNTSFTFENIRDYHFTQIEGHLLFILAILLYRKSNFVDSNIILEHLLNSIMIYSKHHNHQIEKILHQISYNYHRLDLHWNALLYAEKGIDYATSNHSLFLLANFYGRKAIANYYLDQPNNALDSMLVSMNICKATRNTFLYKNYKNVFLNQYNGFGFPNAIKLV